MKYQLYFPMRQGDQLAWLRQFQNQLPSFADRLGLTSQTVASTMADLSWLLYFLGDVQEAARLHSQAVTATTKALIGGTGTAPIPAPVYQVPPPPEGVDPVPPGALKRIFKLVRVIKIQPAYTTNIGLQLGIEGNLHVSASAVPTFQLQVTRGAAGEGVTGKFSRYGHAAVYVETRRAEGEWEKLGTGIYPGATFRDDRPLLDPAHPEIREYRLCFWDDDSPNGDWSVVSSVTVSP